MVTVRRVYLYLVSAISLIGVTWSVIGLARLIISEGIGQGQIIGLAGWLAVIIVGLPIFLFHWLAAQRLAAGDEEERGTVIRRVYLYGVMAAGAAPIISNSYYLLESGLLALVGTTQPDYYPYDLTTGEHLVAILVWLIIWAYNRQQLRTDNRILPAQDSVDENGVRRIYLLAFALAGLVMVTWGAVGLLQLLMEYPTGTLWRTPVANNIAKLIVGGVVWAGHWALLQQTFFSGDPAEERSVLRKLYLYLAIFAYSVMAISSATTLLKRLLELALGAPPAEEPLLSQLSMPVPLMVVGAVFWAYHWSVLRKDSQQAPELPRQAGVRRIYAYLVAAIGLLVLLTGVGGLLSTLVDLLTRPNTVGLTFYREQVALFVAMVVVGIPVWLIPWRAMQQPALLSPGADDRGEAERRSTVRKAYLYFFVFIAAIAVFSSLGWFVFHILTALLGADLPDDFITQVLDALVISILAAGVWFYHWWAIRHDGQLEREDQTLKLKEILVVVIDGDEGKLGQAVIHQLHHDLPGLSVEPVGLTPRAAETMGGQTFSAKTTDLIQMAHYIIGSWQALTVGQAATAVTASTAKKLVVPISDQNWVWTGIKDRTTPYYARQAARGVKQAVEGEEITPTRDFDLSMIMAIIGGILLLLLLSGGFLALVLSNL